MLDHRSGSVFCLLLGVSWGCARPITGQAVHRLSPRAFSKKETENGPCSYPLTDCPVANVAAILKNILQPILQDSKLASALCLREIALRRILQNLTNEVKNVSDNKSLHKPILIQNYVAIWCHGTTMSSCIFNLRVQTRHENQWAFQPLAPVLGYWRKE